MKLWQSLHHGPEQLLTYLVRKELPEDQTEARRIVRRSAAYTQSTKENSTNVVSPAYFSAASPRRKGNNSYQKFTLACAWHHAAPQTLVSKAFRAGFYWPTA